jgi:hypothetical protein
VNEKDFKKGGAVRAADAKSGGAPAASDEQQPASPPADAVSDAPPAEPVAAVSDIGVDLSRAIDGATGEAAKSEPAEPGVSLPAGYSIAPGKSLTCKRGVLGPGESVEARDFHGGQANLDELVSSGYVLKT